MPLEDGFETASLQDEIGHCRGQKALPGGRTIANPVALKHEALQLIEEELAAIEGYVQLAFGCRQDALERKLNRDRSALGQNPATRV